jgi:hypothetical protein
MFQNPCLHLGEGKMKFDCSEPREEALSVSELNEAWEDATSVEALPGSPKGLFASDLEMPVGMWRRSRVSGRQLYQAIDVT